jgi:hypothetical protein
VKKGRREVPAFSASSQLDSELLPRGAPAGPAKIVVDEASGLGFFGYVLLELLAARTVDEDCDLAAASVHGKVYHGRGSHP